MAVGIDLFYVPDVMNQKSVPILNVVDLGTNYQMVEVLENKEPAHIWRTFWRVWARTFGLPQYVAIDGRTLQNYVRVPELSCSGPLLVHHGSKEESRDTAQS